MPKTRIQRNLQMEFVQILFENQEAIVMLQHASTLTKKIGEPLGLLVVFDRHSDRIEKHQNYNKPVEPLRFHCVTNPKSKSLFGQPKTFAAPLIRNFWFKVT